MKNVLRFIPVAPLLLAAVLVGGCSHKARMARLIRSGDADFAAERYDKAESEYKDALSIQLDAHCLTHLGEIYSRQGRLRLAFAFLSKSDEVQAHNPVVKAELASVYNAASDPAHALDNARQALTLQPTNLLALFVISEAAQGPDAVSQTGQFLGSLRAPDDRLAEYHTALATLDLKRRDSDNAQAELRRALSLDAKNAEAHYRLSEWFALRTNIVEVTNELKTAVSLAPWRSPIRLKAADFLFKFVGVDPTRQALRDILTHAPDYIPAWNTLMKLDFASKQYEACDSDIAAILDRDPDNFSATLQAGIMTLSKGENDKAFAAFQKLEGEYPHSPEVKYFLGTTALGLGDPNRARQYLTQAITLDTNFVQADLLLAQVELRAREFTAAIDRLNRLIRRQPTIVEPRVLLAQAYDLNQEPQNALAIYRKLVEIQPKDPRMNYLLGSALADHGDLAGAADFLNQSLKLDPSSLTVLTRLVDVETARRHYDDALAAVQQRIDKDPKVGLLWLIKAQVYRAQNQNTSAESALNNAIQLDQTLAPAYVSLADLYVSEHKEQQAIDKLNFVLARTNDVSALMSLGVIHQRLNQLDAAIDAYKRLLAINPNFSPALNNLACVYSDKPGQLDQAYLYASQAHNLRPYDPACSDTLGWILFKRGDYNRALTLVHDASDGDENDPEIQYHLGMAYCLQDDDAPARVALQKAISSSTSFPGKDDASLSLRILSIDPQNTTPAAVKTLEDIVQQDPKNLVAARCLAQVYDARGDSAKAGQLYTQVLAANPKDARDMARLAALDAGPLHQPDDAAKLAGDAFQLDSGDPLVCASLGRIKYQHGDFDYALALLQKAASGATPSPSLFADLARAEFALGRAPDALSHMRNAAAHETAPAARAADGLFVRLAQASTDAAAAKSALPDARAALQTDPHDLPALAVTATAAEAAGDLKGALNFDLTILSSYPSFWPAQRQAALLYAQSGDDDKATALAEKARTADPDDPALQKILGLDAYRRKDFNRSAQFLQNAATHSTTDSEIFYYLAWDQYNLKHKDDSKKALQKALALNLPSSLAADAKRLQAELAR